MIRKDETNYTYLLRCRYMEVHCYNNGDIYTQIEHKNKTYPYSILYTIFFKYNIVFTSLNKKKLYSSNNIRVYKYICCIYILLYLNKKYNFYEFIFVNTILNLQERKFLCNYKHLFKYD